MGQSWAGAREQVRAADSNQEKDRNGREGSRDCCLSSPWPHGKEPVWAQKLHERHLVMTVIIQGSLKGVLGAQQGLEVY